MGWGDHNGDDDEDNDDDDDDDNAGNGDDDGDNDDDVRQVLVVVDGPMVHYHGKGVRHYVLTLMHIVSPCDHQSSSWFWGDHGDHDELVLTYRHHVLTQTQMQMSHDQKM